MHAAARALGCLMVVVVVVALLQRCHCGLMVCAALPTDPDRVAVAVAVQQATVTAMPHPFRQRSTAGKASLRVQGRVLASAQSASCYLHSHYSVQRKGETARRRSAHVAVPAAGLHTRLPLLQQLRVQPRQLLQPLQ